MSQIVFELISKWIEEQQARVKTHQALVRMGTMNIINEAIKQFDYLTSAMIRIQWFTTLELI
jgi:hypothetical protein